MMKKHGIGFLVLMLALFTSAVLLESASAELNSDPDSPLSQATVSPKYSVVDDYVDRTFYSSIGTDRGKMGSGADHKVNFTGGTVKVNVVNGWAGVWTSLKHTARETGQSHALKGDALLGPYVLKKFQPRITGIRIKLLAGLGKLKVELKDINDAPVFVRTIGMSGGSRIINIPVEPTAQLKFFNWLVDGPGHATVDEVGFIVSSPVYTIAEATFLFSYGHLSQCFDPDSGLVRDRASWPSGDFAAVQSTGMFALATAVAHDRGYVSETTAKNIVRKIKATLLTLPRYNGLLPHYVTEGDITKYEEWSSVDTVIALTSSILACQSLGIDFSPLVKVMRNINWNDLSDIGTKSISHGYDYEGNKLENRWDTFGSESFLVAVAYAASTGKDKVLLQAYASPPTWDGSGFNDELAALFFPMTGVDVWGNDWARYRNNAFRKQYRFFEKRYPRYASLHLFGLSASEIPEPCLVDPDYAAFGVGGHKKGGPLTGKSLVGYPVLAPHYPAMVMAEHPGAAERVLRYLMVTRKVFTPLNDVESYGIDPDGELHWNPLKESWNLSMQGLGASRALSGKDYVVYRALTGNAFLNQGFQKIMPGAK